MRRQLTAVIVATLVALGPAEPLFAQRSAQRGSVSATSRGTKTRSGNTTTRTSAGGNVSSSRTVTSREGYTSTSMSRPDAPRKSAAGVETDDRPRSQFDTTIMGPSSIAIAVEARGYARSGTRANRPPEARRGWRPMPDGHKAYAGTVNTKQRQLRPPC